MSRKRKQLYALLLILGGLTFVVNRVILTNGAITPSSVVASPRPHPISLNKTQQVSDAPSNLLPALPFPQNLPPYDPRYSLRDIFTPFPKRSTTNPSLKSADKNRSDIEKDMRLSRSVIFTTQRRLDAVLNSARLNIAIIDGQWIRVGDMLDGCKLRKLEGTKAYFLCSDGDAVLNLVITDVTIPD